MLQEIEEFMLKFVDSRDSKHLILTHIYLVLGTSLGLFSGANRLEAAIPLCIGDSFAAIVGSNYGRVKIHGKSLEGTIAFVVSCCFVSFLLGGLCMKTFLVYCLVSLVELLSTQVDNLLLSSLTLKLMKW